MKLVAEGLRKKVLFSRYCSFIFSLIVLFQFAPHAPGVVPAVFDKFKEKKPLLRDPLVECIDAIAATVSEFQD